MKNLKAKAVCVMLSASMAAMGLTGCGSENVDGTKTAITVNDESITLGQANFMLISAGHHVQLLFPDVFDVRNADAV